MSSTANRILWTIVGILLAAAGIAGILLNLGAIPGSDRHGTLLTEGLHSRWRSWGGWAPTLVIVVGLIVVALGAALLRAELHRRRGHTIATFSFAHPLSAATPDGHPVRGEVEVAARTLRKALQQDLSNNPSIKHASVTITGEASRPQVYLRLDLASTADLPAIHSYVTRALERFRVTSQIRPVFTETTISGV